MTSEDELKNELSEMNKRLDLLEKRVQVLQEQDEVNGARFYFLYIKPRLDELEARQKMLEKMLL